MKRHWMGLLILAGLSWLLALGLGWLPASSLRAQPEPEPVIAAAFEGTYGDPQERFEIGILPGFSLQTIGGTPLFQNSDGSLAYTVVVEPLADEAAAPLPEVQLLRIAQSVFGEGEGFQTQDFQSAAGGLAIAWTGQLTAGTAAEPVRGQLLAKQQGQAVYLLLVAATEAGAEQVESAIATLADSLTVL